ncbi:hypothetical protein YC2023_032965 [Brassica napus]
MKILIAVSREAAKPRRERTPRRVRSPMNRRRERSPKKKKVNLGRTSILLYQFIINGVQHATWFHNTYLLRVVKLLLRPHQFV